MKPTGPFRPAAALLFSALATLSTAPPTFAATDLPGVRKRLESKKVKFREQVVPRTGAAQIFLYDPDGVGVELNFPPEEVKA